MTPEEIKKNKALGQWNAPSENPNWGKLSKWKKEQKQIKLKPKPRKV